MNTTLAEDIFQLKISWLEEHGYSYNNVLEDEEGEYVMSEPMYMDEGESESSTWSKIYLPDFSKLL